VEIKSSTFILEPVITRNEFLHCVYSSITEIINSIVNSFLYISKIAPTTLNDITVLKKIIKENQPINLI